MMRALIVGSVSAADVCTVCSTTISRSGLRVRTRDATAAGASARRPPSPTADAVQEQLHELVGRRRLAGEHRMRRRQRERAQQPRRDDRLDRDPRAVAPRTCARARRCRPSGAASSRGTAAPTLDTSRQMSMTRCCMITIAAARPLFEGEVRRDVGQRRFERLRVERGLDDGGDDLVLVGEGPEDRALGDARPPRRSGGSSPGRRARAAAAGWRRRSSNGARRAAAPSLGSSSSPWPGRSSARILAE